jgi:hypothetical protein
VLDKNRYVVYHGAFDNEKVPEKAGDVNCVKNAPEDLLAGKPVRTVKA